MSKFICFLLILGSISLTACKDDDSSATTTPPAKNNCGMHCAP